MTSKFKPGDKVWVKARVVPSRGVGDDEVVVRIRTSFGESTIGVVPSEDVIRDTSPWQAIESAPKDGTWVIVTRSPQRPTRADADAAVVRWDRGLLKYNLCGYAWFVAEHVPLDWDPTHYMLIPPLGVE